MHRSVITQDFDPQKTSGLWLVVDHFYGLKQMLAANSLQGIKTTGTHVFLNENLGR